MYSEILTNFFAEIVIFGVIIVLIQLCVIYFIWKKRNKEWTYEEIRKHDGKGENGTIYTVLNGFVFDVTHETKFKDDGMYASFAGYDFSMACANYSRDSVYREQNYDPANMTLKP